MGLLDNLPQVEDGGKPNITVPDKGVPQLLLFPDRIEVDPNRKSEGLKPEFTNTLPAGKGLQGGGRRMMRMDKTVEAELLSDFTDTRSSRMTVTRVLAVGVFAIGWKKKSGSPTTRYLMIANGQGEAIAVAVPLKDHGHAQKFADAVNWIAERS